MKKVFLLLAMSISMTSFSQSKFEITRDGLKNIEQVISVDSISAKEIYSKINKYIQKNYVNPNSVSKGNIENEFISFNGIKRNCIEQKILLTTYLDDLEYYFNIDIKDGKIRVSISKLNILYNVQGSSGSRNLLTADLYTFFKSDGDVKKSQQKRKDDIENTVNGIINDIVAVIKDKSKSNW